MEPTTALQETVVRDLRIANYNARVTSVRDVHLGLRILRVQPDFGILRYAPGQYTTLGLGNWEQCLTGQTPTYVGNEHLMRVTKRAYSISCPLLDTRGRLVRPGVDRELEFYIALVPQQTGFPPGLTPRLFALREGDRLFLGPHPHGHYSVESVGARDDVVLAATGTGEAPHNAMVAELLGRGHRGRIVSITCVRQRRDLGYLAAHRELERQFPHYHYIALTTREPENLDSTAPGFVGKQYLQDYISGGGLERDVRIALDPTRMHVFLCGNPQMVGVSSHALGSERRCSTSRGMIEILEQRGFQVDKPHRPGNIHFEQYW
jgi:ferredoxin--NADP+ reductase